MAVVAGHELVERVEVLSALDAALVDAAAGRGRLALVAGESDTVDYHVSALETQ